MNMDIIDDCAGRGVKCVMGLLLPATGWLKRRKNVEKITVDFICAKVRSFSLIWH